MTIQTQANAQIASKTGAAAQLLASLKANVGFASTNDGLFAGLLNQVQDKPAQQPVYQPQASEAPEPVRSTSASDDQPVQAAQTQQTKPAERHKESSKKADKADKKDEASTASDKKEPVEKEAAAKGEKEPVETAGQAETETKTAATTDEKETKTEQDETLKEWLAALCPLDEKANVVKGHSAEKTAQTDAKTVIAAAAPAAQATVDQAASTDPQMETTESKGKSRKARAQIADALQTKADHRANQAASGAEGTTLAHAKTASATDANVDLTQLSQAAQDHAQTVKASQTTAAQNAQTATSTTPASTQQANADASLVQAPVVGLASQSVAPQKAAAASAAQETVTSVGSASSGSAAQTTAPLNAGAGLRASNGVDFASQLSGLRSAKTTMTGQTAVVEQVSVQLNKMAKDGQNELTINLKPADLGKIEIKLEIHADKTVHGTVVADSASTLSLLSKDSSSLQRALVDAGLQADSGSLSFSLKGDNQNAFAQQNQQGHTGRGMNFAAFSESADDVALASPVANDDQTSLLGRVNLRV